jgi:shikimate kinase
MGAGKSSVGGLLADVMKLRFVDLDHRVEQRAGESIAAIFERRGEPAFRRLETSALAEAAAESGVVVATGGGVMISAGNRELMARTGVTVWLNPDFETIARRLRDEPPGRRPLFRDPARAEALFRQRLPAYGSADLRVDILADEQPAAVAARVADRLLERRCAT